MSTFLALTPAQVQSAFRYREQMQTMMADLDLTGDLLLLALALLDACQVGIERGGRGADSWAGAKASAGWDSEELRWVLSKDVPRYDPPPRPVVCTSPMIRREGPCGRPVARTGNIRDPETGLVTVEAGCSRHWEHLTESRAERARQAWIANGTPKPPNNTGGVLSRYFDTDWAEMYRWANFGREVDLSDGGKPPTPKPKLTLIQGGAA